MWWVTVIISVPLPRRVRSQGRLGGELQNPPPLALERIITKNCIEGEGKALQEQNYSKCTIIFKRKNSLLSERGLRTLWDLKHGAQAAIPAVLLLHQPLVYHTSLQHGGKEKKKTLLWMAWTPHVLMGERAFPPRRWPPCTWGPKDQGKFGTSPRGCEEARGKAPLNSSKRGLQVGWVSTTLSHPLASQLLGTKSPTGPELDFIQLSSGNKKTSSKA